MFSGYSNIIIVLKGKLPVLQIGDQTESITFDLRPSDAINIAVRCKVLF